MRLTFDPAPDKSGGIPEFFPVHLAPWIFSDAEFEPAHSLLDVCETQVLAAAELHDGRQIGNEQTVGGFNEPAGVPLEIIVAEFRGVVERAAQRLGH